MKRVDRLILLRTRRIFSLSFRNRDFLDERRKVILRLILCVVVLRTEGSQRAWSSGSAGGGGMCSDSESAGGSSETRSMDSPTASPGTFSGVNT